MKTELIIEQHIRYDNKVKFELPDAATAATLIAALIDHVPKEGETEFKIRVYEEEEDE